MCVPESLIISHMNNEINCVDLTTAAVLLWLSASQSALVVTPFYHKQNKFHQLLVCSHFWQIIDQMIPWKIPDCLLTLSNNFLQKFVTNLFSIA